MATSARKPATTARKPRTTRAQRAARAVAPTKNGKLIYTFAEGNASMRSTLGGKGCEPGHLILNRVRRNDPEPRDFSHP